MRSNNILNFESCVKISMKCQNKLQKDTITALKQNKKWFLNEKNLFFFTFKNAILEIYFTFK